VIAGIQKIKKDLEGEKNDLLQVGDLQAGNFHPDFILWMLACGKQ
jgi:hypothetical protein